MADQKLGLPVRTEVDADERLQVKLVDATNVAQQMIIDSDSNAHVEVHGNNPGGSDEVLRMSELGAVVVDGVYDATNNSDPAQVGLVAMQANASPADSQQTLRLTAVPNGAGSRRALDIALLDEAGEPFTRTNPVPVEMVDSTGVEVVNYDTQASLAAAASDNHDYTVTALKTLEVDHVLVAASARAKYEVRQETAAGSGIFNTVAVWFTTSAQPAGIIHFERKLKVVAGAILRVIRTNTDNQAQDVYSTIVGVEVQ